MRTWTLDEAREALPRVRETVDRIQQLATAAAASSNGRASGNGQQGVESPQTVELSELVDELTAAGIVVRDLVRGLIDFPARTEAGREYLICWLSGEPDLAWWHWPEDGFAGRRPLSEPPE